MSKLQAKDLMIGNWVMDGKNIAQITSITCDGIIETTFNKSSNIEVIEPISLTREILEKNGWDGRYGPDCFDEDNTYLFEIDIDKDGKAWRTVNGNEYTIFEIKWVHQLQNALKVCGIEKEIIL